MKKAIIRMNVRLLPEEKKALYDRIQTQWQETGLVVLGPYCDVFIVDDAEIEGGESDEDRKR